jgi:uncharacterized protein YciI
MGYFLYKLIPPRPTFDRDMNPDEAAIMGQHIAYWQELADGGTAVVFGPVSDPEGAWGLAVVEADSEEDVQMLRLDDPARHLDGARFEVYPMPGAIGARPRLPA